MRHSRVLALSGLLSLAAVHPLLAQLCAGTAPFSAGPVRLAATAQFGDHAKAFGGQVAFGAANGPFAGIHVGQTSYDEIDDKTMSYGGQVGFSTPVDKNRKVDICPVLTAEMQSTTELDTGIGILEFSGNSLGLGIGVGGVAGTSPTFDFVPFASASYVHATSKATFGGTTDKSSDDFGVVILGTGFVLKKTVTIQPNVSIPVGLEGSDPSYGISIAINLGARK